jgi:hypothetical protein
MERGRPRLAARSSQPTAVVDHVNATREIPLQLLEDAISLVHPDKHPAERAARANRVTADLLALRPASRRSSDGEAGRRIPLWVTALTLSTSGLVVSVPAMLLSIHVNTVTEGAALTLFDSMIDNNPSSGEIKPLVGTRWLAIQHHKAIYARIRGAMSVTFFYLR